MTVIDRKQMIKNYVDNANEAFISMVEGIISSFEDDELDIWDELPDTLKAKYERIINNKDDRGISHEEMQETVKNLVRS